MYGGQPEWSLFAVQAPIDEVSTTFAKMCNVKKWLADVPLRPAGGVGDDLPDLVAVIQVQNNPWTIVFRSLWWVGLEELKNIAIAAKELSAKLKTKAITFIGEDTSGAMGYELFERGKSLERAEWEGGSEFSLFKSKLREEPEVEEIGDEFADEIFRAQGIYLPSCYSKSENGKEWLAVNKISKDVIQRADLIEL